MLAGWDARERRKVATSPETPARPFEEDGRRPEHLSVQRSEADGDHLSPLALAQATPPGFGLTTLRRSHRVHKVAFGRTESGDGLAVSLQAQQVAAFTPWAFTVGGLQEHLPTTRWREHG